MSRHGFDLATLKAKGLPRCTFDALGVRLIPTTDATPEEIATAIAEARAAIDKQFAPFIPPQKECIGCGEIMAGGNMVEAFMRATFTYGLCHGEGYCRNCGYPARANHYAPEGEGGLNVVRVLQYHPDELVEDAPTAPMSVHDPAEDLEVIP